MTQALHREKRRPGQYRHLGQLKARLAVVTLALAAGPG